jgi:ADP-ribose pyrophosphatase YjhB (NUDIX family)
MESPKWLDWAIKLQSIAQAGLAYSKDPYDIERFEEIREISVDIVSKHSDLESSIVKSLFCNETGYQTPIVDVRAVVCMDGKILLVKERSDGKWTLPGGWAEVNLSVKDNVIKEVREEAGLDVIPRKILAVLDRNRQNMPIIAYGVYKIFVIGGCFQDNIETTDSGYYSIDDLPDLSVGRVTLDQLQLCFQSINNPSMEVAFD